MARSRSALLVWMSGSTTAFCNGDLDSTLRASAKTNGAIIGGSGTSAASCASDLKGAAEEVPLSSLPGSGVVVLTSDVAAFFAFDARSILDGWATSGRSEEHTSELQSLAYLVCRLLLEKKKFCKRSPFESAQAAPAPTRPLLSRATLLALSRQVSWTRSLDAPTGRGSPSACF